MVKETIKYEDYNGNELEETFLFDLSEAETMELELTTPGGLTEYITRIVNAQNTPEIIKIFKKIILLAYGEKSLDGKRFVKSEELSTAFSQTKAYSKLFMKLSTDAVAAASFINGIVPQKEETASTPTVVK